MTFTKRDFSHLQHFPGTHGNTFDVILQWADKLERWPALVFALVLLALAAIPSFGDLTWLAEMWLFMLVDWALMAALPRAGKSFGPAKPPTLVLAMARLPFAFLPQPLAFLAQAIGTALVIYSFWWEPHKIVVSRQFLKSPKLNANAPPVRLLHLGDLHIERITQRERDLNRLIRNLAPDVIVFSGDFLNLSNIHDPVAWKHCREIIQEWTAPLGVYVVTGSPAVDQEEVVPQVLKDMPLRWLREKKVTLTHNGQTLEIVGMACSHKPFVDRPILDGILGGPPKNFMVLAYHSPDLAPEAAEAGVDLQLSGHTHGGQVRLPFFGAFFAGSLYGKQLECGRYNVNGLTLYVSRGLGMEGKGAPRVRFLCPPEITVWELGGQ